MSLVPRQAEGHARLVPLPTRSLPFFNPADAWTIKIHDHSFNQSEVRIVRNVTGSLTLYKTFQ